MRLRSFLPIFSLMSVLAPSPAHAQARQARPAPTALEAIQRGDVEALKWFVGQGFSVNREIERQTPLMHAAWFGQAETARYLLSKGARVDARDKEGRTALFLTLHYTRELGVFRREIVRLLLAAGANVKARDKDGNTPLLYALDTDICLGCVQPARETVEPAADLVTLLLKSGADPNAKNKKGETAHMLAMKERRVSVGLGGYDDGEIVVQIFGPVAEVLRQWTQPEQSRAWPLVTLIRGRDWITQMHLGGLLRSRRIPHSMQVGEAIGSVYVEAGREGEARRLIEEDAAKRRYGLVAADMKAEGAERFRTMRAVTYGEWSERKVDKTYRDALLDPEVSRNPELSAVLAAPQVREAAKRQPMVYRLRTLKRSYLTAAGEQTAYEVMVIMATPSLSVLFFQVWDEGRRVEFVGKGPE